MTDLEFDRFLTTSPNLLVAPAGYGKTHTIAKSVDALRKNGVKRQMHVFKGRFAVVEIRKQKNLLGIDLFKRKLQL